MDKVTYVGNADVSAIDHLYKMYLQDAESVDIGWQKFFEGFDFARTNFEDGGEIPENFQKEFKVYQRENLNCLRNKCTGKIKKIFISNRSTFFCNTCQK